MTAEGSTVAVFYPSMGTARGGGEGKRQSRQYQIRAGWRFREAAAGMQGRILANVGGSEPLTGGSGGIIASCAEEEIKR